MLRKLGSGCVSALGWGALALGLAACACNPTESQGTLFDSPQESAAEPNDAQTELSSTPSAVERSETQSNSNIPANDPAWWATAQQSLAAGEHRMRPEGAGFEAGNRENNLRAHWSSQGVRLASRTRENALGPEVRFAAFGRAGQLATITPTLPALGGCDSTNRRDQRGECLKRLEYQHAVGVTEWWENRSEGIKQGFTVARRPAGEGPLEIALSALGATTSVVDSAVQLVTAGGLSLRYQDLVAHDAQGQFLHAQLVQHGPGFSIVVRDEAAHYPIEIDPLYVTFSWTAERNQVSANLGFSVAGAGDVNGDGFGDVIVGAYNYDGGLTDEGAAFVYLGTALGLEANAAWSAEGSQATARFGYCVAGAGDVNDDGFSDVIVGAHEFDNGQSNEGAVFVYYGSASGPELSAGWTAESNQLTANFGYSVASAGDVNNDGFSDVIVGAYNYDNGQSDEGAAFVYLGSSLGLAAAPAWTGESNQASSSFGQSVSGAGDVNNDGFSDVIAGADRYDNGQTDEGRAFLYLGSALGPASSPTWTAESNQATAGFGWAVSKAGDVNGDGYDDVIVGAHLFESSSSTADEGRASLFLGGAAGLATSPAWTSEANQATAWFGYSVASAGDVNKDGRDDVIIGAHQYDNGQGDEGRAYLYLGSATGLQSGAWTSESNQASANFGISVAGAGDINNDGYDDVVIGAHNYDNGESNEGRAFVFMGGEASPGTLLGVWTSESDQASANLGISVAGAGDVNADGFGDVIVGAHNYDNGQSNEGAAFLYLGAAQGLTDSSWSAESNQINASFGGSVARAGDVNSDGYDDVVIGARLYDNGETDEGGAFVFMGSASGLAPTAAWTADSNQASSNFGVSVASAGDVDGDGYSDVVVGASQYDNGLSNEGSAFVYLGSNSGLATAPIWSAEGDELDANFGVSVAGAGDVNNNGYDDVIVGAHKSDNGQNEEGRAFLFMGEPSGVGAARAWTGESDNVGAFFGYSVASAGDVNNDGYDDVVVGAYQFDNGQTNEGSVWLFMGGVTGLSALADWVTESNQANAQLGESVAGAGDVNNDGYDDVIVGASLYDNMEIDEGSALVYLGSSSGLGGVAWTLDSNQGVASFGVSVSGVGDVNADGYGDVAVGATRFDNGSTDEGRAFVFMGSSCVGNAGADVDLDGSLCPFDCDDGNDAVYPGAPDSSCDGVDNDCNGVNDSEYQPLPTTCGVGACARAGVTSCVAGGIEDSCLPGVPAPIDDDCDAIDDDCSGQDDEDYAPLPTSCGVGVCATTGATYCAAGVVEDSCAPGVPAAADDTSCDGADQDCSGQSDEDYVSLPTNCGVGACAASGSTSCVLGVEQDSCTPGIAAASDATCNGLDEDCSGQSDEDYVAGPTSCGFGVCAAVGISSCVLGVEQDSCTPGAPTAGDDATCNGVDEDCSGAADEDYIPTPTTCGTVGACAAIGAISCINGAEQDTCAPGSPAADDTTCDGVDDDCSGIDDEDYVSVVSSCGVGACVAEGTTSCTSGSVQDTCTPGNPKADDTSCDGIDDDCDGNTDEDGMCRDGGPDGALADGPDAAAGSSTGGMDPGAAGSGNANTDAGNPGGSPSTVADAAPPGAGNMNSGGSGNSGNGSMPPDAGSDVTPRGGGSPRAAKGCSCRVPGSGEHKIPTESLALLALLATLTIRRKRQPTACGIAYKQ